MPKQHDLSVSADLLPDIATNDDRNGMSTGEAETESHPHVAFSLQNHQKHFPTSPRCRTKMPFDKAVGENLEVVKEWTHCNRMNSLR